MSLTLPQLYDGNPTEYKDELPHVLPQFFMPRLQDKPQDPIMDTLRIKRESIGREPRLRPEPVKNTVEMKLQESTLDTLEGPDLFWRRAAKEGVRSQIRSWDSLRPSFSQIASLGPFLSEQSDSTFAAARYHVNPRLQDPELYVLHVGMKDLFVSIQHILVGNSSSLYQWDPLSETFVLPTTTDGKKTFIVVDGKDDLLMQSYTKRFLTIGGLLRRLDLFANGLRRRSRSESQSVHSFAHALTTCVENIRLRLSKFPDYTPAQTPPNTLALFLNHEEIEAVLEAIASLCGRSLDLRPSEYPTFSSLPEVLLSNCYDHLQHHLEKGSTLLVRSMLAHIFTVTSGDYLQTLSRSVGYSWGSLINRPKPTFIPTGIDVGDEDDQEDNESISSNSPKGFPSFVSSDATEILVRARKSLGFLSSAQPDHSLLRQSTSRRRVSWFWTNEEVAAAWRNKNSHLDPVIDELASAVSPGGPHIGLIEQFKVFSLEPGTHLPPSARGAESALQSFLEDFPSQLPPLTPTLPHLSDLVLSPLIAHCTAVSGALISLLLSPESHLHLRSHLVLLRSYHLLTLPAFTSRLQAALFSDSDDWDFEGSTVRAMAKSMHSKSKKPAVSKGSDAQWAVGLGFGLAERDSWPPGGSDLSYYLRTVIVDSLEPLTKLTGADSLGFSEGQSRIFAEAEFRLGFAIRDLPAGSGRERWLNPSCGALDFLLMDYKPPPPLDVVITADVLSKYQRIFSFILRLLRVQNALAALFRMTRGGPLFPTLTSANNLLLRFRFAAQSFVSALASHVPDVAVRGNVDPFLARLTPGTFTDVFELADAHSDVMDDVLSACLLRSNQRTAGEALRSCMELVLDLCVLAGERRRSRVEEYAAVPVLETLYASFVEKMNTLVKALREQVERGFASSHVSLEYLHLAAGGSRRSVATGGAGSLYHLLVKLDFRLDHAPSIDGLTNAIRW
ncbi:Spc98 family-domain-containing protein [Lactarius deliciosus]|nr:Spc98 family-domain-containing protein [Lactarius deliciosus]